MSISYNKVILVGRLTRDPEIRSTMNGNNVANFHLAVDRGTSNNQDGTDFIKIVAFGKQADFASNYLKKGKLILVEGSLHINQWTDRDNIKRETAEIWANRMNFMETKKAQEANEFSGMPIAVEEGFSDIDNISDTDPIEEIGDEAFLGDDTFLEGDLDDLENDLSSDNKPI
ncbi:single-stranded DNA-binding protein [Petrotoga sp. 9T1HF07.CasAA.8.2]|jgi:single-strand DNA-binding protein|uniref:single-stranded DNA-binding protein n=1 Tax=Petrotoga sp. 9T1HF07.CasAA.8.2 TaxID=1434329 RepID=UPI000EFB2CBB|nr:single-stranded DNA-binding protein [Petrotoga sp. 9T1HF07.CasAA.8.2]MDK2812163.1 single-strand DNA-binding protein [Petrotoga sp.]